jgi:hypothetical protein
MFQYSPTLLKFLNVQVDNDSQYLLSIYIPTVNQTRINVNNHVKSLVQESFKNDIQLSPTLSLNNELIEEIRKKVHLINDMQKGLAILVNLSLFKEHIEINELNVLPLIIKPTQEVFVGRYYKLDQLLLNENSKFRSLIIDISKTYCSIYEIANGKEVLLEKFEDEYRSEKESESSPYSAFSSSQKVFGGGEYHLLRREEDEKNDFILVIRDKIKDKYLDQGNYDFVVVSYSASFPKIIENKIKVSNNDIPKYLFINKSYENEKDLFKKVLEEINRYRENEYKKDLKIAKENPNIFTDNINQIIKAAQLKMIDTLYMTTGNKYPGFIWNKDYISTEKVENSKPVDNIIPYLIRTVANSGGKILTFKAKAKEIGLTIATKLRYELDVK